MTRIADKKTGRLTKRYRESSAFYTPARRGRKPNFWRILFTSNKSRQKQNQTKHTLAEKKYPTRKEMETACKVLIGGCVLFVLALLLIGLGLEYGYIK